MPSRRLRQGTIALLLGLALVSVACKFVRGPAGFWKTYESDLIVQKESDQGPWGGERAITWHSDSPGTLTFDNASRFAASQGWKLVERAHYDGGAGNVPFVQQIKSMRPEFLRTPSTIGRFETGWIREEPGTEETSPAFGYVQVSDDGTQMYVHHFWGNG